MVDTLQSEECRSPPSPTTEIKDKKVMLTSSNGVMLCATLSLLLDNDRDFRNPFQPGLSSSTKPAILVTHPHSLLGGNAEMMGGVARHFAQNGFLVMRLNFRGVGGSSGTASVRATGGEVADLLSAADYLHEAMGASQVFLVGYSTGAAVSASAIDQRSFLMGMAAIAFPFGGWWGMLAVASRLALSPHFEAVTATTKPTIFLMGDQDEITSVEELKDRFEQAQEPKKLNVIKGAGHFSLLSRRAMPGLCEPIIDFLTNLSAT